MEKSCNLVTDSRRISNVNHLQGILRTAFFFCKQYLKADEMSRAHLEGIRNAYKILVRKPER
jgi:hypothetical protein